MTQNEQKIKELLLKADKPARYCGGEFNTPEIKSGAAFNFLLCFPDVYEVAHSNLGIKILYHILNGRPDAACETCYAPWRDFGSLLMSEKIPLFSLETRRAASGFDMIGFSLQYELSYTNIPYMLELAGLPVLAAERGGDTPVVIGGGSCTANPAPLADFFDLFCIGDGEDVINALADAYIANKKAGGSKKEFIRRAAGIRGIYAPTLRNRTERAIVKNLDAAFYPTRVQIPNTEAVHNRAVLEIFRGCTRGCRFCQAGMIYRPVRGRNVDTLVRYAEELIDNNGFGEITLSSLSTCDYPHLRELLEKIKPLAERARVNISLPSTRVDSFEAEFADGARKSSLTFAPEAGTRRLRDVINKNVTEEDIFASCRAAFAKGYSSIKLYFMIGLPTETQEDIAGIVGLCREIKRLYFEARTSKKPLALSVSASTFVPKPFTPFQWERQISLDEIIATQAYLRAELKKSGVKFSWHDGRSSRIEAALARGDEKTGAVILSAYKNGCLFDGWNELFDYGKWLDAFAANGVDLDALTAETDVFSALPWDNIDAGVSKKFLLSERERAYAALPTPDCRKKCNACGVRDLTDGGDLC